MESVRNECASPMRGRMTIGVRMEAFETCHVDQSYQYEAPTIRTGVAEKECDLATKQLAQFVQALILNSTQTISDTSAAGHSVANASATTAPTILAGTGSTAATVLDTALQTQTETVSGTVNAYSGSGSSGTFTLTGTITAGADRAYVEVGARVTNGGNTYLISRDTFSVLNVSNTGTLAVTYTYTWS